MGETQTVLAERSWLTTQPLLEIRVAGGVWKLLLSAGWEDEAPTEAERNRLQGEPIFANNHGIGWIEGTGEFGITARLSPQSLGKLVAERLRDGRRLQVKVSQRKPGEALHASVIALDAAAEDGRIVQRPK